MKEKLQNFNPSFVLLEEMEEKNYNIHIIFIFQSGWKRKTKCLLQRQKYLYLYYISFFNYSIYVLFQIFYVDFFSFLSHFKKIKQEERKKFFYLLPYQTI